MIRRRERLLAVITVLGSFALCLGTAEAVLRFRQGVGRLIRRADDRGAIVVCDPRLATASYRAAFQSALPVPITRWQDATAMAEDVSRFLSDCLALEEEP